MAAFAQTRRPVQDLEPLKSMMTAALRATGRVQFAKETAA
jgi:hypothetical protein